MALNIPQRLTRRSIAAHAWLGLFAGVAMYVICLSGALVVFAPELERWEQPYAEEFRAYDGAVLGDTFNATLADIDVTPHMYLVLPTDGVPRARIASENESWFINADGSLGPRERNAWTELMVQLHLYLHLPKTWGMILVSAFGAVLVGLTVSGLFAHRRLVRDAFRFRFRGTRAVSQLDVHNRLSVWSTPFVLMIAITGAYFGLALPFLGAAAPAFFDGDRERVIDAVFGEEPALEQPPGPLAIASALEQVGDMAPQATPLMVVVHDAGTPGQFMSVAATHPGRLIYAENYLFAADGTFLRTDGFLDGEAGRQVVYSIYRLHFGWFGGVPVKLAYVLLGLALAVISATGINVWLARRKQATLLDDAWAGCLWGVPLGMVTAAILQILLGVPGVAVLWGTVIASMAIACRLRDAARSRRVLRAALGAAFVVLAAGHAVRFGGDALAGFPLVVNVLLVVSGAVFLLVAAQQALQLRHRAFEPRDPGFEVRRGMALRRPRR